MFFMMLHFVRALGDDDLKQERITRTATDFMDVDLIKMLSEVIRSVCCASIKHFLQERLSKCLQSLETLTEVIL
jgi:hypothetical protein